MWSKETQEALEAPEGEGEGSGLIMPTAGLEPHSLVLQALGGGVPSKLMHFQNRKRWGPATPTR